VVQLSINAMKPLAYHLDLGARLAPMRERGVLIAASGNVVHNLGRIDVGMAEHSFAWAQRFGEAAGTLLAEDPESVAGLEHHPDFRAAAPTPDHFIPLLYLAGVAAVAGRPAEAIIDGYAYGSLSMASYALDPPVRLSVADLDEPAPVPDPAIVPTDDTNM
jgi:4,5-DOPA dioxygenase extradiol